MNKEIKFPPPRLDGDNTKKKAEKKHDKNLGVGRACSHYIWIKKSFSSEAMSDQA